jgi:hypothetical protein
MMMMMIMMMMMSNKLNPEVTSETEEASQWVSEWVSLVHKVRVVSEPKMILKHNVSGHSGSSPQVKNYGLSK